MNTIYHAGDLFQATKLWIISPIEAPQMLRNDKIYRLQNADDLNADANVQSGLV
jgi:hypothetical protein